MGCVDMEKPKRSRKASGMFSECHMVKWLLYSLVAFQGSLGLVLIPKGQRTARVCVCALASACVAGTWAMFDWGCYLGEKLST